MNPQKPQGSCDEEEPPDVGMTALMLSAQTGAPKCIKMLLGAKAKVNAIEEDGWTALHFAAKEGHLEACRTLLKYKADHQMKNSDGMTPLDLATEDNREFAKMLRTALDT